MLGFRDTIRTLLREPAHFEEMLDRAELRVVGQDRGVKPAGGRELLRPAKTEEKISGGLGELDLPIIPDI
jgi:hypothetical protein